MRGNNILCHNCGKVIDKSFNNCPYCSAFITSEDKEKVIS